VPPTGASDAWRAAARARRDDHGGSSRSGGDAGARGEPPRWEPEEWIDEGALRDEATGAVERSREGRTEGTGGRPGGAATSSGGAKGGGAKAGGAKAGGAKAGGAKAGGAKAGGARPGAAKAGGARPGGPKPSSSAPAGSAAKAGGARAGGASEPAPVDDDLRGAVPSARLPRFAGRLREAADAFNRERFEEARRILRPLAAQAPRAASVRELYGLSLYRLGRWAQAARELEAYRSLTGSTEQNPVLADAYRALGRYAEAEELWDELRAASPRAELVAEGRIVAAGALADQGRLEDAIDVLAPAVNRPTRKPRLHHLRMAYALADLYERAGDLPRARELFGRIAASDAEFVDVDARLRALR
jgi:thioredoxin-like negative regulator of GroEL